MAGKRWTKQQHSKFKKTVANKWAQKVAARQMIPLRSEAEPDTERIQHTANVRFSGLLDDLVNEVRSNAFNDAIDALEQLKARVVNRTPKDV